MELDGAELWHRARLKPSTALKYRPWHRGHFHALRRSTLASPDSTSDRIHLEAAAAWLGRAQDASKDGGVAGRYRLDRGWTSSYPETTGYIVPTFVALGDTLDRAYWDRAARCIDFLLGVQLPQGAFPALEIAENRTEASPFNTAQIIHGLTAWSAHAGDARSLAAARRAGEWLLSVQDEDGAWRRSFYLSTPACYSAYLSCWIADLGVTIADERFLAAASRHVDWVMSHYREETGWFERTGFLETEHARRIANLHTIAYTLAGLLHSATVLDRPEVVAAVMAAASRCAATGARHGWLPAVMDWQWRARADSQCLTGSAQMALVWMQLYRRTGDRAWLAPADAAIESVKRVQLMSSPNPDLRGGVPGSWPLWGSYMPGRLPSWAAKFLIDALLMKERLRAEESSS